MIQTFALMHALMIISMGNHECMITSKCHRIVCQGGVAAYYMPIVITISCLKLNRYHQ